MTNVYTRKHGFPRTTTLLDFNGKGQIDARKLSTMSPTRRGNPHPLGLIHQSIPSTRTYMIWNPDFARIRKQYPIMMNHLHKVNFTCKTVTTEAMGRKSGQVPVIHYDEKTISRSSYRSPSMFPDLKFKIPCRKQSAATGIVPNLHIPPSLPAID